MHQVKKNGTEEDFRRRFRSKGGEGKKSCPGDVSAWEYKKIKNLRENDTKWFDVTADDLTVGSIQSDEPSETSQKSTGNNHNEFSSDRINPNHRYCIG